MATDAKDDLGWAGGAEQAAARAELERLKRFGDELRKLTRASTRIRDPADRAALQDRSLEAFEAMTAKVGLLALDRMREMLRLLAETDLAAEAAGVEQAEARIAAAQKEIDAVRDRESAALLQSVREALAVARGGAGGGAGGGADLAPEGERYEPFEPFDDGPDAPDAAPREETP